MMQIENSGIFKKIDIRLYVFILADLISVSRKQNPKTPDCFELSLNLLFRWKEINEVH